MNDVSTVAVFGSSQATPADPSWAVAERVGALLATSGIGVANGGYGGLMEAVSRGAARSHGKVIGVTSPALFPQRSGPNSYISLDIKADSLTERVHLLCDIADGFIALPGSIGTFTELIMAVNDACIAPLRAATPRPIVAMRDPWESELGKLSTLASRRVVTFADSADEAVAAILGSPAAD